MLCALTSTAFAQGVTLYGNVDGGVAMLKNGTATVRAMTSGINSASSWGLRGSEDLGDGLRAIFQLEAGLDLDTGAAKSFSGNPSTATPTAPNGVAGTGFNRRSYVGLEGSYGTIAFGRDYAPVYYALRDSDALRLGLFGNLQEIVQLAGGSERWARASNALFYTSPKIGGVRGRVMYSFGSESAGGVGGLPKNANTMMGLGVDYSIGGLELRASYQELKYPLVSAGAFTGSNGKRKDAAVGGTYRFGDFAVSTGYWKAGTPQNTTDTWLGATMKMGVGTVLAQVQRLTQDNPTGAQRRGNAIALAYTHSLSRRTTLYASYGKVTNNSTGNFAIASSDVSVNPAAAGADPSGLGLGIRHTF
jgi:predicted porin